MCPKHGCNALHHTPTLMVARVGVEPTSPVFQTGAETASATRPLIKIWWSVSASNRSAFRIASAVSTPSTPTPRGDRRDLNPHDWSHNPVPEPFGHGHTCWSTRADSNCVHRFTGPVHLHLCFECYESFVTARVNEQVLRPLVHRHAHRSQQAACGVHGRRDHAVQQFHARLFRRPRVLGLVALLAGGYQVLPRIPSSARTRQYMIESQLTPMELPVAVLTGV